MGMIGKTQAFWHHRVPKEKGRGPRININFRKILPNRDDTSIRGVRAFYKYMVCGDAKSPSWNMMAPSFRYADIVRQYGPMHGFVTGGKGTLCAPAPASAISVKLSEPAAQVRDASGDGDVNVPPQAGALAKWECSRCTLINVSAATVCAVCGASPIDVEEQESSLKRPRLAQAQLQVVQAKGQGQTKLTDTKASTKTIATSKVKLDAPKSRSIASFFGSGGGTSSK
jgi:hypothetical protein